MIARLTLFGALVLTGCAAFDSPPGYITTAPGYACSGTVPECGAVIATHFRQLQSPAMTKAICEAGGVAPECPGNELPR
jgi:hypothetical protein